MTSIVSDEQRQTYHKSVTLTLSSPRLTNPALKSPNKSSHLPSPSRSRKTLPRCKLILEYLNANFSSFFSFSCAESFGKLNQSRLGCEAKERKRKFISSFVGRGKAFFSFKSHDSQATTTTTTSCLSVAALVRRLVGFLKKILIKKFFRCRRMLLMAAMSNGVALLRKSNECEGASHLQSH
jgi:hypothetical protein